jgi:hypothetical protein
VICISWNGPNVISCHIHAVGHAVATSRKVAGSSPDEVDFFFQFYLILPAAYGPGIESASNRNEYQESSWGSKAQPARKADLTAICEPIV